MAMVGDDLATAVMNAIAALSTADKGDMAKVKKAEWGAVVTYLKNNMEIKGVAVNVTPDVTPMTAGGYPVLGNPGGITPQGSIQGATGTQSNDGTGHVA